MKGFAAALTLALTITTAQADGFCDTLAEMQAIAGNPDAGAVTVAFPDGTAAEASCRAVLELGGIRSLSCNWAYDYRSDAAREAFELLAAEITACVGAPIATEAPVNHPDSYDLLSFASGIGAALKDKAALQETHVILRVQAG